MSVPDDELRIGSHWRIESNNLETRWRLSQAFINATRIDDNTKQAVTMQKPWGGTSDRNYLKLRCHFCKEMGPEDKFLLPREHRRTCNIKRQNGIATNTKQMEEVQAAIERISNSNSDTENQDNISDEGTNATAVDIQSLQKN